MDKADFQQSRILFGIQEKIFHIVKLFCEYKIDVSIKILFDIKILCNVVKTEWRYETNPRGSAGYARKAPSLFLGPLNKPNDSYVKMLR